MSGSVLTAQAMDVEMKEPSSEVSRESGDPLEVADEDLYPRLKALQRQQEFLGIQVWSCLVFEWRRRSGESVVRGWECSRGSVCLGKGRGGCSPI